MFYGTATITPWNPSFSSLTLRGTWLYKPTTGCWYCQGRSFDARTVSDFVDEGMPPEEPND